MATDTTQSETIRHVLRVDGMHCAGCVGSVERALESVDGVVGARVNLVTRQAQVVAADATPTDELIQAVEGAGFNAGVDDHQDSESLLEVYNQQRQQWLIRFGSNLIIFVVLLVCRLTPLVSYPAAAGLIDVLLSSVCLFGVCWPILFGGLRQLIRMQPDMDSLIAMGTLAAFLAGIYGWLSGGATMTMVDVAMILTFISLGRFLESTSRREATRALAELIGMAPQEVTVLEKGSAIQLPVVLVDEGAVVQYQAGDRIALDGEVITGKSEVDESWLTGESLAVPKASGDAVFAGTVNGHGVLETRVTQPKGSTMLDRVIELVNEAQTGKAQLQSLADRVVRWFVPAVILIATTTFVGWLIAGAVEFGLSSAVAVLIVACPCALGLATPVAILVASSRAAKQGILVKNAQALEATAQIDTVVFDKTGTLTQGQLSVQSVRSVNEHWSEDNVLALAAAVERHSRHPVAQAVASYADSQQVSQPDAENIKETPGSGLSATVNGRFVAVGNARLMDHYQVDLGDFELTDQTTVMVASDSKLVGAIELADQQSEGSQEIVQQLQESGVRVVLLSGDRIPVARQLASELNIEHVEAELLPDDKFARVKQLSEEGQVAMVGDGINDAPALSAADLGIAIGAGADVAIESADVVLMRHDLRQVGTVIELGRRTVRTIKQNLGWAFAYNLFLIPIAAGLLKPSLGIGMHPAFAASAMAISSLSVVLNSLSIRVDRAGTFSGPSAQT